MQKESSHNLYVIIIGGSDDLMVSSISRKISKFEIAHVICKDIYSAAAQLAKNNSGKTLVIGRFENLKKENQWFLKFSNGKNIICCCIKNGTFNHRFKNKNIVVIEQPEEIEDILTEIINEEINPDLKTGQEKFIRKEFQATREELNALLQAGDE